MLPSGEDVGRRAGPAPRPGPCHTGKVLHLTSHHPPWAIDIWSGAASSGARNQDTWLIDERPGGALRLAAIDGVTPMAQTPDALGLDGAVWAAQMLRTALLAPDDLPTCLQRAHAAIHRPDIHPARARPAAGIAACDLAPDGALHLVRASDVEAWLGTGDTWRPLMEGPRYTAPVARESEALVKKGLPREAFLAAEADLVDDPGAWQSPPVGFFATLPHRNVRITPPWDALVLASDGALLDEIRLGDLDQWLGGDLRRSEVALRRGSQAKARDDVTVIRVVRTR